MQKFNISYIKEKGCLNVPYSINISLTERCYLACPFCFKDPQYSAELELDQVLGYLREMGSMGVKCVQFSGGEPLLYPHLITVIKYAKTQHLFTRISSSGWGLDEDYVVRLKKAGIDVIHISLNGSKAVIHEKTRDAFDVSLAAIEMLVKNNIEVVVNWVANHSNIDDLPNMIQLAKRYKIKKICILSNKNNYKGERFFPLEKKELIALCEMYKDNKQYLDIEGCYYELNKIVNDKKNLSISDGCRGGRFYMAISARNEFSPCPHFTGRDGYKSIKDYWGGDSKLMNIRETYNHITESECLIREMNCIKQERSESNE